MLNFLYGLLRAFDPVIGQCVIVGLAYLWGRAAGYTRFQKKLDEKGFLVAPRFKDYDISFQTREP